MMPAVVSGSRVALFVYKKCRFYSPSELYRFKVHVIVLLVIIIRDRDRLQKILVPH